MLCIDLLNHCDINVFIRSVFCFLYFFCFFCFFFFFFFNSIRLEYWLVLFASYDVSLSRLTELNNRMLFNFLYSMTSIQSQGSESKVAVCNDLVDCIATEWEPLFYLLARYCLGL
jgi:hypothetical protein